MPKYINSLFSAICGGVINIGSGNQQIIKSPGYDDKRYYLSHQECSWWIKVGLILDLFCSCKW